MGSKYLLAWCGLMIGCGTVVPLQRSERAVVGWGSGYDYCMEPVGVERTSGGYVLASTYGVGQGTLALSKQAPSAAETQTADPQAQKLAALAEAAQAEARVQEAQSLALAELTLFAREGMYRICEARRNGDLTAEQAQHERRELSGLLVCLVQASNTPSQGTTGPSATECVEAARNIKAVRGGSAAPKNSPSKDQFKGRAR